MVRAQLPCSRKRAPDAGAVWLQHREPEQAACQLLRRCTSCHASCFRPTVRRSPRLRSRARGAPLARRSGIPLPHDKERVPKARPAKAAGPAARPSGPCLLAVPQRGLALAGHAGFPRTRATSRADPRGPLRSQSAPPMPRRWLLRPYAVPRPAPLTAPGCMCWPCGPAHARPTRKATACGPLPRPAHETLPARAASAEARPQPPAAPPLWASGRGGKPLSRQGVREVTG
jgi:hypothetical protein